MFSEHPYPGLRPYTKEEFDIYFGREKHRLTLLDKLHTHRLISVIGPSGCGKSSLLEAGLIASVKGGSLTSSVSHWWLAEMVPSGNLFRTLAESLVKEHAFLEAWAYKTGKSSGGNHAEALGKELERAGITAAFDGTLPPKTAVLLLVDQFEEIFQYVKKGSSQSDEATLFVSYLLGAAAQKDVPVYVVIGMRTENIGQTTFFYDLPEAISESQFIVPRLTDEEIRCAIRKPLRYFDCTVGDSLIQALVSELKADQDDLPLLQHALKKIYEKKKVEGGKSELNELNYLELCGGDSASLFRLFNKQLDDIFHSIIKERIAESILTLQLRSEIDAVTLKEAVVKAYDNDVTKEIASFKGAKGDTAGSEGALSVKLKTCCHTEIPSLALTDDDLEKIAGCVWNSAKESEFMIRGIFNCLANTDDGFYLTRRTATIEEIAYITEVDHEKVVEILEKYVSAGYIRLSTDTITYSTEADVSHESLLRKWARLRGWYKVEVESASEYKRLADWAERQSRGAADYITEPELSVLMMWKSDNRPTRGWAQRYDRQLYCSLQRMSPEIYTKNADTWCFERYSLAFEFLDKSRERAISDEHAKERENKRKKIVRQLYVGLIILIFTFVIGSIVQITKLKSESYGKTAYSKGDIPLAISYFKKAIKIGARNSTVYVGLGTAYLELYSRHCNDTDYNEAETAFGKAIEINSNAVDAYVGLGNLYLADCAGKNVNPMDARKAHKAKKALTEFASALAVDPNNIKAHTGQGDAYSYLRQYKDAVRAYTKAATYFIKANDDVIAIYSKASEAISNIENPDLDEMIGVNERYLNALKLPSNVDPKEIIEREIAARNALGFGYWKNNQLQKAREVYGQTLSLDHNNVQAYRGLGHVLLTEKKYAEAIANYDKAISLNEHLLQKASYNEQTIADRTRTEDRDKLINQLRYAYLGKYKALEAQGDMNKANNVLKEAHDFGVNVDPRENL